MFSPDSLFCLTFPLLSVDPQLALYSKQDEEGVSCVRSVKLDEMGLTEGVSVPVCVGIKENQKHLHTAALGHSRRISLIYE